MCPNTARNAAWHQNALMENSDDDNEQKSEQTPLLKISKRATYWNVKGAAHAPKLVFSPYAGIYS